MRKRAILNRDDIQNQPADTSDLPSSMDDMQDKQDQLDEAATKGRPRGPKPKADDPCPCGSGKKYGRCCGQSAETGNPSRQP